MKEPPRYRKSNCRVPDMHELHSFTPTNSRIPAQGELSYAQSSVGQTKGQ